MFKVNEDKSIYVTRGDYCEIPVAAVINGEVSKFKSGDVLRFKATKKKDCNTVVIQRDYLVDTETDAITFHLTGDDTRIGAVISKPTDYWYEVELNPDTDPQTIIGYDEDGAKVLRLFPEGADVNAEDIEVVGKQTLQDLVDTALALAKASGDFDGADGKPGVDGKDGYTPQKNVDYFDGKDGKDGLPGQDGSDGITPHIGDNGNWFVGDTDTGKPSRGIQGEHGKDGSIDVTAEVGQTIVVEEVDENGKPTKWKAMDYQPRTHWEETNKEILFEGTLRASSSIRGKIDNFYIEIGKKYNVLLDGVLYENLTAFSDNLDSPTIGEAYNYDEDDFMWANFPFSIWREDEDEEYISLYCQTGGEHTLTIYIEETVVHKVPDKFLHTPDWNASEGEPGHVLNRTHWVESEHKVLLDTTVATANSMAYVQLDGKLEEGQTYTVTFAGQQYSCLCECTKVMGLYAMCIGNMAALGGTPTDEPFAIGYIPSQNATVLMVLLADGEYSVKIEGDVPTYHTIHPNFLPKPIWLIDIDVDNPSISVSEKELTLALENGEMVALREKHSANLFTIHHLVGRMAYGIIFSPISYGSATLDYYILTENENGGYDIKKASG